MAYTYFMTLVFQREGFSKFNKIYEFKYNVRGQNADMIMTSVSGHLLNLDFDGQYKNWRGCDPLSLFDAPIIKFCPKDYENIKVFIFMIFMFTFRSPSPSSW